MADVWALIKENDTCPIDALLTITEKRGYDPQTAAQIAKSDQLLLTLIETQAARTRSIVVDESPFAGTETA